MELKEKKFRAWNPSTKNMLYSFEAPIHPSQLGNFFIGISLAPDSIVMQSIGLIDGEGVEMYEGDWISNGRGEIWLIEPINSLERDGNYYGLCVSKDGSGDNYFYDKGFKDFCVIGNIFQIPDPQ